MKLGELLRKSGISCQLLGYQAIKPPEGWRDLEIRGITDDSRRVERGFLFVAVRGWEHDGHDYVEQAIENGASAVLFDVNLKFKVKNLKFKAALVGIRDSRKSLGLLWAAWYGWPAKKLKVIGVTGTDGKTTTANLIYHLLETAEKKVGLLSTLGARMNGSVVDTGFHVTTPSPELLQKLLARMVQNGLDYAVLEATSHGLDQERLAGVKFHAAVITNVTHEHLDYHKTYQNYLKAKAKLFEGVNFSVFNRDDRSYGYLRKLASGKVVTYGIRNSVDVRARNLNLDREMVTFTLDNGLNRPVGSKNYVVSLSLPGEYNVYNALAAFAVCRQLGLKAETLVEGLKSFRGLKGRFEEIKMGQPFRVVVDFAHTPNALRQVLELISEFQAPSSKIICVFGCAGERDRGKRAMMGEISGKLADISILTAEDPRREDVNEIIGQIAVGCRRGGTVEMSNIKSQISKIQIKDQKDKHYFVREPDRRRAIELAVKVAQPGDVVIITGKGHEKSMCYGTKEYPWSDLKAVKGLLKKYRESK